MINILIGICLILLLLIFVLFLYCAMVIKKYESDNDKKDNKNI